MANTQGDVNITPQELNESFHKFRKDLIEMPVYALAQILPYVTLRPGVRYKETVGELKGDMQLAPFKVDRRTDEDVKIAGRTLETYLGNAVHGFNPNSVLSSIYGSDIVQGEALKGVPITKKVWTYLFGKLGEHIFDEVFSAVRNPEGSTTHDLFDGFVTIANNEKTAGNISAEKGNFFDLKESITAVNAVDKLEAVYDAMNSKLQGTNTNMLCSPRIATAYNRDYRQSFGSLPYNHEFKKTFIEGSNNRCAIVPLVNMPDDVIIVTEKKNLLVGCATSGTGVKFEVKDSLSSHWLLDFVASMFFGCQFESINKERLLYAKVGV